jgi:hypothetical protein
MRRGRAPPAAAAAAGGAAAEGAGDAAVVAVGMKWSGSGSKTALNYKQTESERYSLASRLSRTKKPWAIYQ